MTQNYTPPPPFFVSRYQPVVYRTSIFRLKAVSVRLFCCTLLVWRLTACFPFPSLHTLHLRAMHAPVVTLRHLHKVFFTFALVFALVLTLDEQYCLQYSEKKKKTRGPQRATTATARTTSDVHHCCCVCAFMLHWQQRLHKKSNHKRSTSLCVCVFAFVLHCFRQQLLQILQTQNSSPRWVQQKERGSGFRLALGYPQTIIKNFYCTCTWKIRCRMQEPASNIHVHATFLSNMPEPTSLKKKYTPRNIAKALR